MVNVLNHDISWNWRSLEMLIPLNPVRMPVSDHRPCRGTHPKRDRIAKHRREMGEKTTQIRIAKSLVSKSNSKWFNCIGNSGRIASSQLLKCINREFFNHCLLGLPGLWEGQLFFRSLFLRNEELIGRQERPVRPDSVRIESLLSS